MAETTVSFTLNGRGVQTGGGRSLLAYLREEAGLTAAKNGCGEGSCGACSVLLDGSLVSSCTLPIERAAGKSVTTVEGIPPSELDVYVRAFSKAGAVQCGFCTPGMVMAAKALLDRNPDPTSAEVRAGLRRNLCRCTGYAKIVDGVLRAARLRRDPSDPPPSPGGVGAGTCRVDAALKVEGRAKFVDDLREPGMLYGAALRTPHPRARLLSLDLTAARALEGVELVAAWNDIPGSRFTGHVVADWPTLVAVGEETRYVGDAVALVAARSPDVALRALELVSAAYEVLEPVRSPAEALAPGAPALHPKGNVLSRLSLKRGNAQDALAKAAHVVEASFHTPFTDHAFMEPESALAYPPDADGVVLVRTGEQNVYDGRRYVADTLGLPPEKVRVVSAYVGGGFGGKEDQTVQHFAALLAFLSRRPVKFTFSRAESLRVHVKRHAMSVDVKVGCDGQGKLTGLTARIVADTGAYASLGGPVLHRAVVHAGGPYSYGNIDVEGISVFTNNPPAGAFRGFGVPQVNFAVESALDLLASKAGLSAWDIRYRNAVRPGDTLPNGQTAGPDTALAECLLAVRDEYGAAGGFTPEGGRVGIACGFKNTGLGVGHEDVGRCILRVGEDHVEVRTGAACIGQGLTTVLTQIVCSVLGLAAEEVRVLQPDTLRTPDSGTTTASRQTLFTGEACRRACAAAKGALDAEGNRNKNVFPLAGREFYGEYEAPTDPLESAKPDPVLHVAFSYACQLVVLGEDGRVARVVAAQDSGTAINPLSYEGQVEGGVVMGLGYALTEDFPLADCVPTARFGRLGLMRAPDVPEIRTIIVGGQGREGGAAYGAKGVGEICTVPTASAAAGAYFALDGTLRTCLPLSGTPYRPGRDDGR